MKYILAWFVLLITLPASSQVVIQLQLPPAGLMLKEQLWSVSLLNTESEDLQVQLEMQLSDVATDERVLTGLSRTFILPKGLKHVRLNDVVPVTYNVLNTAYPVDANPSGTLPIGVFNVCYTVILSDPHGQIRIADECQTIEVEPISPPLLVLPADKEEAEQTRPLFNWSPPMPVNLFGRLSYDLTLVEVIPPQSAADAVSGNIPVLYLPDIRTISMQYPASLNELDTAKTYAWRIKAKNNMIPVAGSEIWTFRVRKETGEQAVKQPLVNYTRLNEREDASYIRSSEIVYYQYRHQSNNGLITLKLHDVSSPKRITVPLDNPVIAAASGENFMKLDLRENPMVINGHMYLLEVTDASDRHWYLKFEMHTSR